MPPFASAEIRERTIDALLDPARRFISHSDTTSRGYLNSWGLTVKGLCEDLAEHLEKYELYLKPKGEPHHTQKYQFVLPYGEDGEFPAILVHVTLSPKGDPPRVKLAVHPHNTGYEPLQLVHLNPSS
ncbi:MAG: hypothetical protein ACI8UO_006383 [Verrucomicrobiales bacterium]|jgi:hypothetical protein